MVMEPAGFRPEKRLGWRGPTVIVNGKPIHSSERAPHVNKLATI
jgi:hypothetical protein